MQAKAKPEAQLTLKISVPLIFYCAHKKKADTKNGTRPHLEKFYVSSLFAN